MNSENRTLDVADPALPDRSLSAISSRRFDGTFLVDEWGLDSDLAALVGKFPTLRWGVRVEHAGRVPDGPALIVHSTRRFGAEWAAVAVGVGRATGRSVRFTGVPDVAPVVGIMRRLGGVGSDPADVRGLLRAGNLVSIGLDGGVPAAHPTAGLASWAVDAALETGAPIVPVAVRWAGLRALRPVVRIGEPVPTRRRTAARASDEVALVVRERVAALR